MSAKVLAVGVMIVVIGLFLLLRPDLTRIIYDYGEVDYYEFNGVLTYPSLISISVLFLGIIISIAGLLDLLTP
jgi:hypothetical protein